MFFSAGEATKFGRNDSSSPAPPTSLSTAGVQSQSQQAPQAGTQGQGQGQSQGQQTQNQAFLNPPLPPGYGYTGKIVKLCFDDQNLGKFIFLKRYTKQLLCYFWLLVKISIRSQIKYVKFDFINRMMFK